MPDRASPSVRPWVGITSTRTVVAMVSVITFRTGLRISGWVAKTPRTGSWCSRNRPR
jgi:hypothetical protein